DQHALFALTVEFAVEYLLPGPKIKFSVGYRSHDFAAHDLPLQVRVRIVLEAVMFILAVRFFRGKLLEPHLEVMVQPGFVIVDEYAGRDVHGVDKHKPVFYPAFVDALLDLRRYIDIGTPGRRIEIKHFTV